MARPLRIERAGGWYYVTARGNDGRAIYRDARDRQHFSELLAEVRARFGVIFHAYVLMDNHYHLLLELREANLSRAMQWLGVSYSIWFNRRHGRTGHFFQGRFKSVIMDPGEWALRLSRYLHLNPVRSTGPTKTHRQERRVGLTPAPNPSVARERAAVLRHYPWSSYRAYIGLAKPHEWLECEEILRMTGTRDGPSQRKYQQFVEESLRCGLARVPWEELRDQIVLGSREFLLRLSGDWAGAESQRHAVLSFAAQRPSIADLVANVEQMKGQKWDQFRDQHNDTGRDWVLYLARKLARARLKDLAALAGVNECATITMAVKRLERRLMREKSLQNEARVLSEMLKVKL